MASNPLSRSAANSSKQRGFGKHGDCSSEPCEEEENLKTEFAPDIDFWTAGQVKSAQGAFCIQVPGCGRFRTSINDRLVLMIQSWLKSIVFGYAIRTF